LEYLFDAWKVVNSRIEDRNCRLEQTIGILKGSHAAGQGRDSIGGAEVRHLALGSNSQQGRNLLIIKVGDTG
jgi:hypothetical protein